MLEIYEGSLPVEKILNNWYEKSRDKNFGALINFIGIAREEDDIIGLSFDIYEPLLNNWFNSWQSRAKVQGAYVFMAHSKGDVLNHHSSYIAAVLSRRRKVALKMIDEFVEDFKASAPIWKYDMTVDGKRVYAKDRSTSLPNSGLWKK